MREQLKWHDGKADNSSWINALAELRQRATSEGGSFPVGAFAFERLIDEGRHFVLETAPRNLDKLFQNFVDAHH